MKKLLYVFELSIFSLAFIFFQDEDALSKFFLGFIFIAPVSFCFLLFKKRLYLKSSEEYFQGTLFIMSILAILYSWVAYDAARSIGTWG